MIHIYANSADLVRVSAYNQVARPKSSKATKLMFQHKKARFDDVVCASIDRPKTKASKQARQNAAKRAAKRKQKANN